MPTNTTRRCFKCGYERSIWDFPLNRAYQSGRDVRCRFCVAETNELVAAKTRDKFNMPAVATVDVSGVG